MRSNANLDDRYFGNTIIKSHKYRSNNVHICDMHISRVWGALESDSARFLEKFLSTHNVAPLTHATKSEQKCRDSTGVTWNRDF